MRFNAKESASKVARYLRETRSEMKKIIWPGRKETLVYTAVVAVTVAVVSSVMWGMDILFSSVVGLVIR